MKKLLMIFLCLLLILLVATSCKDGKIPDIFEDGDHTTPQQQEESDTTPESGDNGEESSSESDSGEESSATSENNPQPSGLEIGQDTDNGYGPIITP